jgi:hypothetical protein
MRNLEILQHNIEYWYRKDQELTEQDYQHIEDLLHEGFSSGQLVDGDNIGWWSIIK